MFLRAGGSDNHHDLGLFTVGERPSPPPQVTRPLPPGVAGRHDRRPRRRGAGCGAGTLVGATDHGVSKSLYAKDPDGIEFEVMWQVPPTAGAPTPSTPALEPLDLPAELARWAGVPTG